MFPYSRTRVTPWVSKRGLVLGSYHPRLPYRAQSDHVTRSILREDWFYLHPACSPRWSFLFFWEKGEGDESHNRFDIISSRDSKIDMDFDNLPRDPGPRWWLSGVKVWGRTDPLIFPFFPFIIRLSFPSRAQSQVLWRNDVITIIIRDESRKMSRENRKRGRGEKVAWKRRKLTSFRAHHAI